MRFFFKLMSVLGRLRRAILVYYYRGVLKSVGRGFRIGAGAVIVTPRSVSIWNDCFFGPGLYVSSSEDVDIGNGVMFGPQIMIIGGDHDFQTLGVPLRFAKNSGRSSPIVVENDVWIGARCTILKGVRIGTGSIIGAGSVLTRDIPAYSVAAGVPCRVIRPRFSEEELEQHRQMLQRWLSGHA